MITVYDSVTASDIPLDAPAVAGYIDGPFKWNDAHWARFPNAHKIRIATMASTNDGDFLDVERGDATPEQAPFWIRMRRKAGHSVPGVYVNLSNVVAVLSAFGGRNLPVFWLAHYDGMPTLPSGYIGKQYANAVLTGHHYDLSIFDESYFGTGGFHMDNDVNLALRIIAVTSGAAGAGAKLVDIDIVNAAKVVETDFTNLGSVVTSYAVSHPGNTRTLPASAEATITFK